MLGTILWLSLSGLLLALALMGVRRLLPGRISHAALYYLWIVVLLRLCLPFGSPFSLPDFEGTLHGAPGSTSGTVVESRLGEADNATPEVPVQQVDATPEDGVTAPTLDQTSENQPENPSLVAQSAFTPGAFLTTLDLGAAFGVIWLLGVIATLTWQITRYRRFCREIKENSHPAAPHVREALDELGGEKIRLLLCQQVGTPMLLGLKHPTMILPREDYNPETLTHILRHELCHHRRRDLFYKWCTMVVLCLHWFNPLLKWCSREISTLCELSCDEAVVSGMALEERRRYGETLLTAAGSAPVKIPATTLGEEKAQMKGRLLSIVNYRKRTPGMVALALILALVLTSCGAILGTPKPPPLPPDLAGEVTPFTGRTALSVEEIRWFNEEYFTEDPLDPKLQLLIYYFDRPEEISFYSFDNGIAGADAIATAEEEALVAAQTQVSSEEDLVCIKLTAADFNRVLEQYLGLSLEETEKIDLDAFTYLAEYDAYYCYALVNTYPANATIEAGERDKEGNIWLYYSWDAGLGLNEFRVVRLWERAPGEYLFLSNGWPVTSSPETDLALPTEAKEYLEGTAFLILPDMRKQHPQRNFVEVNLEFYELPAPYTVTLKDGRVVHLYRGAFGFRSLAETPWQSPGVDEHVSSDGYVYYGEPTTSYFIFLEDGERLNYQGVITAEKTKPTDNKFHDMDLLEEKLNYQVEGLKPKDSVGTDIFLDYADKEMVIFHGFFGLFVYDLEAKEITMSVDFLKTLHWNKMQGDIYVRVDRGIVKDQDAPGDRYISFHLAGDMAKILAGATDFLKSDYKTGFCSALNLDQRMTVHWGPQISFVSSLQEFVPNEATDGMVSAEAVKFPDGLAYIGTTDGTIGGLYYQRGDNRISLFENYF